MKTTETRVRATKRKVVKRKAVAKTKMAKLKVAKVKAVKAKIAKPKAAILTAEQLQEKRSQAARKAALALWEQRRQDPNRAPSKKALREQIARIPTAEITVEHYADRPNPRISWAAAILKRKNSSESQRREAGQIVSESYEGKRESPWSKLSPEQRSEIARRGGARRWAIWREEQAMLQGRDSRNNRKNSRA